MRKVFAFLSTVFALCLLAGCGGGGGGGGSVTITGRVLWVETGAAPNPQATVQVGSNTTLTSASDGSFSVSASLGATTVLVDTHTASGVWSFTVPTATATEDVGDLWVGPTKVTLTGQAVDSSSGNGISGATLSFGGQSAKSDSNGNFSIQNVAYPSTNLAAFWGIVGQATATGYFANSFTASPNTSVSGTVTIANVLMTPLSNSTPPPTPYNIWGRITPSSIAPGTLVTLSQSGTAVRKTSADSTGTYYFWVTPGSYTISFVNGTHTSADQSVTVTATNDVERRDAVLN